ncbi:MAG TPA: S41 family peptidase [Thermoanaerobaculia bacterium]|nr:S41 family peptidase [Thermoanaerobaculia bacterium]
MSQPRSRILIALCLVVAATLVGGALGERLPSPAERDTPPLDEYADILTTISDWAPEPVSPDKFVYASIHGMLSRLDPHTAFLEPDDYAAMREKQQGSFFGLGIQIQKRMGKITVIAPMEGTPAFKLGIRAGDIITHIEDEELKEEVSTDEVVRKLRGPKGTQVTITIRRAGIDEPIHMTITRAEIPTRAVPYAFMITPETGYIFLRDFTHTSSRELANAIDSLEKQGMKKLMLDLRGNPGGVLDQAVDISDIFLGKGAKVVYTRGRTASSAQDFFAPGEGPHFDKPLVVLVNRGSASASEIVAGAIQDHDRGLIVGQRTWGKGLVQSVYTLPYGAGLALTTARYYTPSGRWIQRDYSDLLAYVNPDDPDPAAPEKASEETKSTGQPFYTDAGRIVFAAGGITPDVLVKNSFDSKLVTQLLARNMFFNFAVQWLPRHPEVKQDLQITPSLRQEFFAFVEASKFSTADELSRQWNEEPNKNLLDYALRIDIANVHAGLEAGWKVRASGDMQVQKGLTLFDEAARVAALPKKASPSRAAKTL